jgi:hypothetical protein
VEVLYGGVVELGFDVGLVEGAVSEGGVVLGLALFELGEEEEHLRL